MTPAEQIARWVAGEPRCPNDRGECCPDFSCCRPSLLWPEAARRAFAAAAQPEREHMLLGSLAALDEAAAPGADVRVIGQAAPAPCSSCGAMKELRPYGKRGASICLQCMKADPASEARAARALRGKR